MFRLSCKVCRKRKAFEATLARVFEYPERFCTTIKIVLNTKIVPAVYCVITRQKYHKCRQNNLAKSSIRLFETIIKTLKCDRIGIPGNTDSRFLFMRVRKIRHWIETLII